MTRVMERSSDGRHAATECRRVATGPAASGRDLEGDGTHVLVPCHLHGALHPVEGLIFRCPPPRHAIAAQEFAWVLLAAALPTCRRWLVARDAHSRRLRFDWTSPVPNVLLTIRALGSRARWRAWLAAAAAMSLPDRPLGHDCLVRCRTHQEWEAVTELYPVSGTHLAVFAAQLGTVLAGPCFTTCDQVRAAYELLVCDISPNQEDPADEEQSDTDALPPMQAYLGAARVLHRFLSDPTAYTVTRSLETLP